MPVLTAKRASLNVASIPAPVGGWNARDSLANMDPLDAVQLENMFPTVSSVVLRGGYTEWATGLGAQVQTLMAYASGTTQKMFAIAGTSVFDVTATGPVGAAVVTGLSNAKWEYTNVTTAGGSYLYMVNGVDAPRLYDGTTWASVTGVSTIAITGVTTTTLTNVVLFKNRVWFIQADTLKAWYLPTSAVGGAAQVLDLSSFARRGGYLVAAGTWTLDAGYGVDDNLVFVTSEGEVIVFRGSDPASSATWAMSGLWQLGAPVGKRCLMKFSGDLLLLTFDGLYPLAAALQSSRLDPRVALTDKIQGAIAGAIAAYSSTFGWTLCYSARNNALMVNVPVAVGEQQQYVMNTITKNWGQFTGWHANCWEVFEDAPYFGGNGIVGAAWSSDYADNGAEISSNTLQAFNYFDSRGTKKYFTRARPTISTDGNPDLFLGINVDFDVSDTTAVLSPAPTATGVWDAATWDASLWGSGLITTNSWQGVTGVGTCGGVRFLTASSGLQIEWASTDVVYQIGWAGV